MTKSKTDSQLLRTLRKVQLNIPYPRRLNRSMLTLFIEVQMDQYSWGPRIYSFTSPSEALSLGACKFIVHLGQLLEGSPFVNKATKR